MPVCSSGTSGPRANVPVALVVDQAYVQSLLPPVLSWLYQYLPFMHGLQIEDVAAFCSVDPPTWTLPSAVEFFGFRTGSNLAHVAAVNLFMQDITRAFLWYNTCQCNAVATPAPPAAPSAPVGLPAINPPGIVGSANPACSTQSGVVMTDTSAARFHILSGIKCDVSGFPACVTNAIVVTPEMRSVRATWVYDLPGTMEADTTPDALASIIWRDAAGTFIAFTPSTVLYTGAPNIAPYSLGTAVVPIPAAAHTLEFLGQTGAGFTATVSGTLEIFCDSQYGYGATQGCCTATDPLTTAALSQILQLLTLTQRQVAPFAYIPGASHAGLTGSGTLTIPECIGIRVEMTTIPGWIGEASGSPLEYFDAGWYSWGNTDGFLASERLSHSPQLSFPNGAQQYTRFGYSFAPGVVADVQELYAEP